MALTDAENEELEILAELRRRKNLPPEERAKWEERYQRQEARAADTRTPAERMQAGREVAFRKQPWQEELYGGIQKPFKEMGIGARALVQGGLTPEAAGQLRQLQGVSGPVGTAGELAGNIGMYALPGGLATRGVSQLPKALARRQLAKVAAGEVAGTGIAEGIREPGDLGERAKAGAIGAGVTAVLPAVGGVLTGGLPRTLKGLKRSSAAQKMLDEGVPLTPGAASGKGYTAIENFMAKTPYVAGKVNKQRQAALDEWNKKMLREVAPPGTVVDEIGTKGIQQVKAGYKRHYDDLWDRVNVVGPQTSAGFSKGIQDASELLIPKHSKRVSSMLDNWNRRVALANKSGRPGKHIENLDDEIRLAITKAKTPAEKAIFENARQSLRAGFPGDTSATLRALDGQYAKYAVIERATTQARAARNTGVFTPNDLTAAVRQQAGRPKLARGEALLQPQAAAAQETIGKALPVTGTGGMGKLAALGAGYVSPPATVGALGVGRHIAATEPMRRGLTGGGYMDRQGRIANLLRRGGPYTLAGKKVLEDEDEPRQPAPIYNPARR